MGKNADAVVAAVTAAGHGNTEAVTDFKELVAKIDANAAAAEATMPLEASTEATHEPLVITAVEVVANDNASPEAPLSPQEAVADGTTDDTRAPLVLTTSKTTAEVKPPKAPRKPLINWPSVHGTMKAVGNTLKQGLGRLGNFVGSAVVGFIVVCFYGILQLVPGIFYVVGWTIKELATAYSNGYNQRPLFNNTMPEFGSKPVAVVAAE